MVLVLALVTLAACGAGVNEDLVATPTPYLMRSPVAAGATPEPDQSTTAAASFVAAGQAALAADDPVAAERAFDRALIREPAEASALLGRAEARLRRGNLTGARDDLLASSQTTIDDVGLLTMRGELRLRYGDLVGAEADFTAAIVLDPGRVDAFTGRARAILASAAGDDHRYEAALADFRRALTLDPASTDGRLGPAMVFVDRARFDGDPEDWRRAEAELAGAAEQVGTEPAWAALMARAKAALGAMDDAAGTVAAGLGQLPAGPELARLRTVEAELALVRMDWAAAEASARAGIAADGLAWEARYVLVQALLGAGRADEAILAAQELLDLLPGDGRGLYHLGLALQAQGKTNEAREVLRTASGALPESAVYQARTTVALDRGASGSTAGAVGTPTPWIRLRELEPETPAATAVRSG